MANEIINLAKVRMMRSGKAQLTSAKNITDLATIDIVSRLAMVQERQRVDALCSQYGPTQTREIYKAGLEHASWRFSLTGGQT